MSQSQEEVTTISKSQPVQVVKTTTKSNPPIQTEPPQQMYQKKKVIFRTYQIIWYVLGVIEVLLVFRLVLKMVGANSVSGFTSFIYSLSDPIAMPFSGILHTSVSPSYGSVFEWSTLIAMTVYAVVAYGIVQLLQLVKPTTPDEVEKTVDSQ